MSDTATITGPSIEDLWAVAFVAENDAEACLQAERQYEFFHGRICWVHGVTATVEDEGWVDGIDFTSPIAVVPHMLSTESGWDGEVLYPEWAVRFVHPAQVVTLKSPLTRRHTSRILCLRELEDVYYTAPGVGTAEGFTNNDPFDFVLPDDPRPWWPRPSTVAENAERAG